MIQSIDQQNSKLLLEVVEKQIKDMINQSNNYSDSIWLMVCSILFFLFVLGVAIFNSSLGSTKNLMNVIMCGLFCFFLGNVEWILIGFSLINSTKGNILTGTLHNMMFFGLTKLNGDFKLNLIKNIIGIFSTSLTMCVLSGVVVERGRIVPFFIFVFLWSIVVFDISSYWISNPNSWCASLIINASGGGPNICIGVSALVYSWFLGKRKHFRNLDGYSDNQFMLTLGTMLIFVGWLGVGGTLTGKLDARSIYSMLNFNLAGVGGGFAWMCIHYISTKTVSMKAFNIGMIGAFIGVAPGVSVYNFMSSFCVGILSAIITNYSPWFAFKLDIDDTINLFAFQGVGSFAGLIFAALFSQKNVPGLENDGYNAVAGMIDGNYKILLNQLLLSISCALLAFIGSIAILLFITKIMRIKLKVDSESELIGMDVNIMKEVAFPLDIHTLLLPKENRQNKDLIVDQTNKNKDLQNNEINNDSLSIKKDHIVINNIQ